MLPKPQFSKPAFGHPARSANWTGPSAKTRNWKNRVRPGHKTLLNYKDNPNTFFHVYCRPQNRYIPENVLGNNLGKIFRRRIEKMHFAN